MSLHPVPYSVSDGIEIVVKGVPSATSDRFSINLCSGTDLSTDIPLHFNPRFDDNQVVSNHYSGGWGHEERGGDFPFVRGVLFEVRIYVTEYNYRIYVNGSRFTDFVHRIDKELVKNVIVDGDTRVSEILVTDKRPINNPAVPLSTPIKGGLVPGNRIIISGKSNSEPSRFNVNLLCGESFEMNDIALHYDARFNYGAAQNTVVCNHRTAGNYGTEERDDVFFPFVPGEPFELFIDVEADKFTPVVNFQKGKAFSHRILALDTITHLAIQGDVELFQIRFEPI